MSAADPEITLDQKSSSDATPIQLPLLAAPRAEVFLVETAEELEEAVQTLAAGSGPFAVDAERASGFKYSQRAYLIQVYRAGSRRSQSR